MARTEQAQGPSRERTGQSPGQAQWGGPFPTHLRGSTGSGLAWGRLAMHLGPVAPAILAALHPLRSVQVIVSLSLHDFAGLSFLLRSACAYGLRRMRMRPRLRCLVLWGDLTTSNWLRTTDNSSRDVGRCISAFPVSASFLFHCLGDSLAFCGNSRTRGRLVWEGAETETPW